jgi:hypothetical protein
MENWTIIGKNNTSDSLKGLKKLQPDPDGNDILL